MLIIMSGPQFLSVSPRWTAKDPKEPTVRFMSFSCQVCVRFVNDVFLFHFDCPCRHIASPICRASSIHRQAQVNGVTSAAAAPSTSASTAATSAGLWYDHCQASTTTSLADKGHRLPPSTTAKSTASNAALMTRGNTGIISAFSFAAVLLGLSLMTGQ